MKRLLFITILLLETAIYAQKPCEFASDFTDSIGSYKETKTKIMHERIFGNSSSYLIFSLVKATDVPVLKLQTINKSKDFIKVNCFEKNSRIFVQLANGKVITLMIADEGNCGTMLRDAAQTSNIRVTSANFLFMINSLEDLKKSPVTMVRVRYSSTETVDYIIKETLVSEMDKETYNPDRFFIENIPCLEK